MVVRMCERLNYNPDQVYDLPFVTFLFWSAYIIDDTKEKERQMRIMEMKNRRR